MIKYYLLITYVVEDVIVIVVLAVDGIEFAAETPPIENPVLDPPKRLDPPNNDGVDVWGVVAGGKIGDCWFCTPPKDNPL